jgi:hypothetical protein
LVLTVSAIAPPPVNPTTYPSVTLSDGSTLQIIPPGAATSNLLDISGLDAEAQAGMLALYAAFKAQKPAKNLPPSPKGKEPATMPKLGSTEPNKPSEGSLADEVRQFQIDFREFRKSVFGK